MMKDIYLVVQPESFVFALSKYADIKDLLLALLIC